jgi:spore maturation protein CgeB
MQKTLNIVIFGLSITSSWGNGHATTFRSLIKALAKKGHTVTFFEKDAPWYASSRDMPDPPFCETVLYQDVEDVKKHDSTLGNADLVILGSYVADAKALTELVKAYNPACFAFYDIDTPVTLAKLKREDYEYLTPDMIPVFDIYFSFTGGPILNELEQRWGARRAKPLYCSVDPDLYYPEYSNSNTIPHYGMGYLGTYSDDRQPTVDKLLIESAKRRQNLNFCVAGAQYPESISWPENVERVDHIPPQEHRAFYNAQCFTLNVTRKDMISAGYAPSVRLFEAGACGTPIISDYWDGLNSFFKIGEEILVAQSCADVLHYLDMHEHDRLNIGRRIREKVMQHHTSTHRAEEIEAAWLDVRAATQPTLAKAASS